MSTRSTIYIHNEPATEPPPPTRTNIYTDGFDDGPIEPVYVDQGRDSVVLDADAQSALFRHIVARIAHVTLRANEDDASIEIRVRHDELRKTAYYKKWLESGKERGPLALLASGGDTDEQVRVEAAVASAKQWRETCKKALERWETTKDSKGG